MINKEQKDEQTSVKPALLQADVSGRFFDSLGNELKEGDVFEYTAKKWKSKAKIVTKNGVLGTIIIQRDVPDKFVLLEKYIKRHYIVRVS